MSAWSTILIWVLFGLVIGVIARLITPEPQPLGWAGTAVLGVFGAFLGGFLTFICQGGQPLQTTGLLISVLGAVTVLMIYGSCSEETTL